MQLQGKFIMLIQKFLWNRTHCFVSIVCFVQLALCSFLTAIGEQQFPNHTQNWVNIDSNEKVCTSIDEDVEFLS